MDLSVVRHGISNGTAVYAYRLAEAMLNAPGISALTCFFGARAAEDAMDALRALERGGASLVHGPQPWRSAAIGMWWLPAPPRLERLAASADVFHAGEFFFPRVRHAAVVATVHDLTDRTHPELHTRWNRMLHARRLRWIERRADRVIAVSDATRAEIGRCTRVPLRRVDRIHEARGHTGPPPQRSAIAALLERFGIRGRYILSVGTLEPRKNHTRLLEAFAALPEDLAGTRLVLAGGAGWKSGGIRRAIASSPVRERVHWVGRVSADELRALYHGASVFAYPSLHEGFGLPILEAMAAGVPVITSNVASLPEVAGDAAILVDPHSTEAIRDALAALLRDDVLCTRLRTAGHARERQFTWEGTARATVETYRRARAARLSLREWS